MAIEIRQITPDNVADWCRALNVGFMTDPEVAPDIVNRRSRLLDDRHFGAFDTDTERCVGTYRSFDQQVTAVGGKYVATNAVSAVTVSSTHRRQGILTSLIKPDLAAAKERGDAMASLIAAEFPIYGRFGFGPATEIIQVDIDVVRTGLARGKLPLPADAHIDLVDAQQFRAAAPSVWDRARAHIPGMIDLDANVWDITAGIGPRRTGFTLPQFALYRGADGAAEGFAVYKTKETPGNGIDFDASATIELLSAVTEAARNALWQFVMNLDWVSTVTANFLAQDDPVFDLLPNPRAAHPSHRGDMLWLRPLDVPAMMSSRTYNFDHEFVLQVTDDDGLASGTFRVIASPDGGDCTSSTRSPDLILPAAELGRVWLGDGSAVRRVAAGAIVERTPGAATKVDALMHNAIRPWCPVMF